MKKTMKITAIACILSMCVSLYAHPMFIFENVTTQNGLSSHDVRCIAQDKYGLMWFGTDEGLNRYDGLCFNVFKHTRSADSGLNSSWINCIYEDSDGNLWIGTEKGISVFDIETGRLEVLSDKHDTGNWLTTQRVTAFHEDRERAMWIGTSQGIVRYDKTGHKLEHFTLVHNPKNSLGNKITCIVEDLLGNLWIGTFDGVWRYSSETKDFEPFCINVNSSQNNYIESIYLHPDDSGHIYLATSTGLTILDLNGNIVRSYNTSNSDICDNDVCCIIKYDDTHLLLGTENGLSLFDRVSETFKTVETVSENAASIPSNYIRMLFEDRNGTIWAMTSMGLSKLDRMTKPIELTYIEHNGKEELINDISRVSDDRFWLATQNGIMICNDDLGQTGRLSKRDGLPHNIVKRIYRDSKGITWVGTNDGILYYDNARKRFVKVKGDGVTFKYIYDIKEDCQGRIITNIPNGICIINPPGADENSLAMETIDLSRHLSQGNSEIPYMYIDEDGTMWIGTICDGLIRIGTDGSIRQYNENSGLASDRIYSLFADRRKNIWIGTDLGLSLISYETGEVKSFDNDIYFSRSIRAITQDENGAMWFGTTNHLIKYNPETDERIVCSLQEQLGIRELMYNSVCIHDGFIFMSGNGFVMKFRPEDIAVNSIAPPVVISNFTITSTAGNNKGKTKEVYVTASKEVHLKHNENSFRINFTMPYYMSSYSNSYMYMLENHDKTWHSTNGRNNWASWSNLKSGSYRFLVKGANSDGVSSESVSQLDIIILPPWWASAWAFLVYVLIGSLILSVIVMTVRSRMKISAQLKEEQHRNARVEKLNEMKMQFFTNISHEFRTPLSLIQGPVEFLMNSTKDEKTLAQLSIIKQNGDRLLDLINQIMDLRKIESGILTLNLEMTDIILYTRQLANNFRIKAANKNICYEIESELDTFTMAVDHRKYEKILFNLISNAMKFTPDGGSVSVHLQLAEQPFTGREMMEISVSDTGCGIQPENLGLVFLRFYQEPGNNAPHESMKGSGIGLVIAKDYVELHEGEISVKSRPGEGSTFSFTIPTDLKMSEIAGEDKTAAENAAADMQEPLRPGGNRPKIIIIEDDQDMLNFLRMMLDTDYDIYTATDGRQGLDMIRDVFPDIILTDLMMAGMDGLELCRNIKGNPLTSHIPVVILTARSSDDTHQQAYETGADSYLTKPFSVKTLHTRLNAILANRVKLQERYRKEFLKSPSELVINSQEDKFIHQLVKIVEDNMADPEFGVQQLCEKTKYPYQQVYRKIKMLTGESLNEFIRNIRLKRAAQYMANTDLRVSEVMYKVGFNSHSYFTKCYKEYFGVPPTEHSGSYNQEDTDNQ